MNPSAVLRRARSAIGAPIAFRLGAGPRHPDEPVPADLKGNCDCSAFVAWALGIQKRQRELSWLVGAHLNVDQIWSGAERHNATLGRILVPRVGALVVFPSVRIVRELAPTLKLEKASRDWLDGKRTGHIGIVSAVDEGRVQRVVHLHPLNFKAEGSIVAETDLALFDNPATIYAWHSSVSE